MGFRSLVDVVMKFTQIFVITAPGTHRKKRSRQPPFCSWIPRHFRDPPPQCHPRVKRHDHHDLLFRRLPAGIVVPPHLHLQCCYIHLTFGSEVYWFCGSLWWYTLKTIGSWSIYTAQTHVCYFASQHTHTHTHTKKKTISIGRTKPSEFQRMNLPCLWQRKKHNEKTC